MDKKTLKKLADQFDELAGLVVAIGGTFRAAVSGGEAGGGDEGDGDGDDAAIKPARKTTRRAAATGAGKAGGKAGGKEAAEDGEVTEDTLRERLKELAGVKGKDAMAEVLAKLDVSRLPDVDEDDYKKLDKLITKAMEAEDEDDPKPAKGKGAKGKKPPVPDLDEIREKLTDLQDEDPALAKKVLRKAGLTKLSELDEDDEEARQELFDAIVAALDE